MIRPDNFRADPLGWAGNQCGHLCITAALAFWLTLGWFWAAGEYPPRWVIAVICAAAYLALELPQRGGVADTVEDILFAIAFAVWLFVYGFSETVPGDPVLVFDPTSHWPAVAVVNGYLAWGMAVRLFQKWRARDA